jgi:hypothetical protein
MPRQVTLTRSIETDLVRLDRLLADGSNPALVEIDLF